MAVNRAVSSHLDQVWVAWVGVPDSAIMWQGRWYSSTFVGDLTGRPASPRDPVATCSYSSPVPLSSASRFSVVSSDIPASAVCDDNSGRRFHSWAR